MRDGEAEQLIGAIRRVIVLEQVLFEFLNARASGEIEGGLSDVDVLLHRKGKGKVIDLERAIQQKDDKARQALLKQTRKDLEAVWKGPDLFTTHGQVNLDLVGLQIVLSRFLSDMMSLRAANVQIQDIMGVHKATTIEMVQNFFCLMEVYGYQFSVNYFDPALYPLQMQRRRSQIDLSALK